MEGYDANEQAQVEATGKNVEEAIEKHLDELVRLPTDELLELRFQKYRSMGEVEEEATSEA